jgi:hypothetical protein
MATIDFEAPATLLATAIPDQPIDGNLCDPKWSFPTVREAIRFCMEKLDPRLRSTAWITTYSGPINNHRIVEAYLSGALEQQ